MTVKSLLCVVSKMIKHLKNNVCWGKGVVRTKFLFGNNISGKIILGFISAIIVFTILLNSINKGSVVGDGFENLTLAVNLVQNTTFSIDSKSTSPSKMPSMKREPVLPVITAAILCVLGMNSVSVDDLSVSYSRTFKIINIIMLSAVMFLLVVLGCDLCRNRFLGWFIISVIGIYVLWSTPRLFNYYNNDAIAMLIVVLASFSLYYTCQNYNRWLIVLSVSMGLLVLTKAQFLPIIFIVLVVLWRYVGKRKVLYFFVINCLLISPWIIRNGLTFGKWNISTRGSSVVSIRLYQVTEHSSDEIKYIAYGFTHPSLRKYITAACGVTDNDFNKNMPGQRFARELGFDMGRGNVPMGTIQGDYDAVDNGDYHSVVQLFWRGMMIGNSIDAGTSKYSDHFRLTKENVWKYLYTLPLYFWRGMGFGVFPLVSIIITISIFMLVFTRVWAIAVIPLCSYSVNVLLTHNVPRYHAIEFGIMIFAASYILCITIDVLRNMYKKNIQCKDD